MNIFGKIFQRIHVLTRVISNTNFLTWIMLGFLVTYLLFFIFPTFFSAKEMQFIDHIPAMSEIGSDFNITLKASELWLTKNISPYFKNNLYAYPPLVSLLLAPFILVNTKFAYWVFSLVSIFCYLVITLIYPLKLNKYEKDPSLIVFVSITGLFSFGFQFELERGQFNVIALFFCIIALWLFHHNYKYRHLAYLLFTISIQLKIYPLIFMILFVKDWQNWKAIIKRFIGLVGVNIGLLFIFGQKKFIEFVLAVRLHSDHPYIWIGNHSVKSFFSIWFDALKPRNDLMWLIQFSRQIQILFHVFILLCLFMIFLKAFGGKVRGVNAQLFLGCAIAALLIPSASHDYKLAILAAPVGLFYMASNDAYKKMKNNLDRVFFGVLLSTFSIAYTSTIYSIFHKPVTINSMYYFIFKNSLSYNNLLSSNFLPLMAMLIVITTISILYRSYYSDV